MYQEQKERLQRLFSSSPFTIDGLKNLEEHSSRLWAKFRHIESVANLMESAATAANFSEKEKLMAFAAGQFHDIACLGDIALTGKEYGPRHGARGAVITFGILAQGYDGFSDDELKIITTAIANHDGAKVPELSGFAKTLTYLLRDCDKIDCYRRQSTEPLANVFQRPLQFDSSIREDFALRCLNGEAIKYAEMQNFNEECLLYLGWFFQLSSPSSREAALPLFMNLAKRLMETTENPEAKLYMNRAISKATSIVKPSL
ncbi:HD domain-containing protein [Candidatus Saccharibacteria bacterium]|nr:HD domain-containing protein [Candidatus Saccharibacteria bacterium]